MKNLDSDFWYAVCMVVTASFAMFHMQKHQDKLADWITYRKFAYLCLAIIIIGTILAIISIKHHLK